MTMRSNARRRALWAIAVSAVMNGGLAATAFAQQQSAPAPAPAATKAADAPAPTVKPAVPAKAAVPLIPAKQLFGAVKTPAKLAAQPVGSYAKGCLAGGAALPITGPTWQVMRLSRNRNWGHPALVSWIERFTADARSKDGWPGVLVGDMSQPRGGPMVSGHASHQVGLDTDMWYIATPESPLSTDEREKMSARSVVNADKVTVDPTQWTPAHAKLIKRAASYAEVERIFVNPAIKKSLCETAETLGPDRAWLSKVRPWWGHDDHFHVRLHCPAGSASCQPQAPVAADDGCGAELTGWLKRMSAPPPKPDPNAKPSPPPKPLTLDGMPAECRAVLTEGDVPPSVRAAAAAAAAVTKPEPAKSDAAPVPGSGAGANP